MSEAPAEESSGEKSDSKRLTPAEWAEACALYETGSAKMTEIAERFGVTISAVSQHFRKNGVVRGSKAAAVTKAVEEAVVSKAVTEATGFEQLRRKRIEDTRTQHYSYAQALSSEIMRQIAEAKSAGRALSSVEANVRTLRTAAAALATIRQERYAILDVEGDVDEANLPTLEIVDLSDDDIAKLQLDPDDQDLELEEIELDPELDDEVVSESEDG